MCSSHWLFRNWNQENVSLRYHLRRWVREFGRHSDNQSIPFLYCLVPKEYHHLIDNCNMFMDIITNLSHHSAAEEIYTEKILEEMKQRPKSTKFRDNKELLMYYSQSAARLLDIHQTFFMSSNMAIVLLSKLHSQVFVTSAMDKIEAITKNNKDVCNTHNYLPSFIFPCWHFMKLVNHNISICAQSSMDDTTCVPVTDSF